MLTLAQGQGLEFQGGGTSHRPDGSVADIHTMMNAQALAKRILALYEAALRMGQSGAAEHLLSALEELARSEPACGAMRDQAYFLIGRANIDA